MGSRGMYLNKWTPDFIPKNGIPFVVPVWVYLPFLPLLCWNAKTLKDIGNTLGRFIDRSKPRDGIQSYAHLCVYVDMEKCFPEAIQLTLDHWSYIQIVNYEQLSFKCKTCHEYGHFTKKCPKKKIDQPEEKEKEQWQQTKRKKTTNNYGPQPQEHKTNSKPNFPLKGKYPMMGNNNRERSKNRYVVLENMESEIVNSKESIEYTQIQHDSDPVSPSKKNDPVFIHLEDPPPILIPPVPDPAEQIHEDLREDPYQEISKITKASKVGRKTNNPKGKNKQTKIKNWESTMLE